MLKGFKHDSDKGLPRVLPRRSGQDLADLTLHVGGHKIAEPRIQLDGGDQAGICCGLPFEAIQKQAFFFRREVLGVSVKDGAERIARDHLGSAGLAVSREPCGEAAQLGDHHAIVTGDESENASDRQAVLDKSGQVSGGEKLRDLSVNGTRPALHGSFEQLGLQAAAKNLPLCSR